MDPSLNEEVHPGDGKKNCVISRPKAKDIFNMKLEDAALPLSFLSEGKTHDTATSVE